VTVFLEQAALLTWLQNDIYQFDLFNSILITLRLLSKVFYYTGWHSNEYGICMTATNIYSKESEVFSGNGLSSELRAKRLSVLDRLKTLVHIDGDQPDNILVSIGLNKLRAQLEKIQVVDDQAYCMSQELISILTELDPHNVEPLFACYFADRLDLISQSAGENGFINDTFSMIMNGEFEAVKSVFNNPAKADPGIGIHFSYDLSTQHIFTSDPKGKAIFLGKIRNPKLILSVEDIVEQVTSNHGVQTIIDNTKKGKDNRTFFIGSDLVVPVEKRLLYGPAKDTVYKLVVVSEFLENLPTELLATINCLAEIGVGSGTLLYGLIKTLQRTKEKAGLPITLDAFATDINSEALEHTANLVQTLPELSLQTILSEDSMAEILKMGQQVDVLICNPPYVTTELLEEYLTKLDAFLSKNSFDTHQSKKAAIDSFYEQFARGLVLTPEARSASFTPLSAESAIHAGITGIDLYFQQATTGLDLVGKDGMILTLFSSVSEHLVTKLYPETMQIFELGVLPAVPFDLPEITNNPLIGSSLHLWPGIDLAGEGKINYTHTIKVVAICDQSGKAAEYLQSKGLKVVTA
jgi:methylase of polypeptide subunit release factors